MSGLLADVFSFGNTAKRKIKGLLDDPMGSITQYINNENDRAGRFNQLTAEAAQEGAQAIKSGKSMVGPKSQQLAGLLADAYNPAGMVVWHGSPHRFTKFDSSKIGTGEGAQAYGHGLYVAESPDVAKSYKASNSATSAFNYKGKPITDEIKQSTAWHLEHYGGDKQAVLDYYKSSYKPSFWDTSSGKKMLKELDRMDYSKLDSGALYKIDLPDEHIAKMLDWDKPLSQQAPEVKKAVFSDIDTAIAQTQDALSTASPRRAPTTQAELEKLLREKTRLSNLRGGDYYGQQSLGTISGQPDAAQFLRQQGIPGIRYLDGGSRGTGQGTSNFVVFPGNEDLLKILEINGKPVGGLMNEVKGPQAEALETARKNAVKMLGLPENNTPMDRAKALGFDTEAFHSTGADFREFKVNPYRGAVSVAAHPSGAVHGAKAGAADGTGTGATSVMPLLMRSEGVQGLRLPQDQVSFLKTLPDVATESQVDELMKSAPKGSFWGNFFNEIQNPDGTFSYARKSEPKVSFLDVQKTSNAADGSRIPNWGDELWSSNRQKQIGGKGWLQQDESGISASIVDPSILRSRFAAFDPARVNENDLLGGVTLPMLGLLSAGGLGAAYLTSDK